MRACRSGSSAVRGARARARAIRPGTGSSRTASPARRSAKGALGLPRLPELPRAADELRAVQPREPQRLLALFRRQAAPEVVRRQGETERTGAAGEAAEDDGASVADQPPACLPLPCPLSGPPWSGFALPFP